MVRIPVLGLVVEMQMVPMASKTVVDRNIWSNNTLDASDVEGR